MSAGASDRVDDGVPGGAAAAALLSHWWSRPTAEEIETWLVQAHLAPDVFGDAAPAVPATGPAVEELLDEHERLFVGPGPVPCPPFESCWRTDVPFDLRRSLMGPCTADLKDLYARLGLELAAIGPEYADYLPVELEAFAVAAARRDTGDDLAASLLGHLQRWLAPFTTEVRTHARHPFYRDLAAVTARWAESMVPAASAATPASASANSG